MDFQISLSLNNAILSCAEGFAAIPHLPYVPCMHTGAFVECNQPYTLYICSLLLTPWQGRVGPDTNY